MSLQCREGHDSTESDYCSVCGAAMPRGPGADPPGATTPAPRSGIAPMKPVLASPGGEDVCPSCGEPRTDEARFCEVCRFDFVARKGGPPPAPVPASLPPVGPWELVVTVDPSLDTDPDPATPCPPGEAERVFAFDVADMLVGRRDDRRDIRPELPVADPGTSRRHAKFLKNADGSVSIQDLASMNGTRFNTKEMVPGSRQVLAEGDEVTLGRWTRIRLRRKA